MHLSLFPPKRSERQNQLLPVLLGQWKRVAFGLGPIYSGQRAPAAAAAPISSCFPSPQRKQNYKLLEQEKFNQMSMIDDCSFTFDVRANKVGPFRSLGHALNLSARHILALD